MDKDTEYLIVIDPDRGEGLTALGAMVDQVASDRLGIVRVDSATLARLRQRADVIAVGGELPSSVTADLDESERLFVDAWFLRREPKRRKGENLPWDAPGFEPPDP